MKKSLSLLLALLLCVLALPAGAEEAEPIVITVGMGVNSSEKYAPGESFDNNAWTKLYEERLGIKLDFVLTADSQYSQKLALAIASGDMPDMWRTDKANFALALEGDMLMDLTDLAEEYLSDQAKEELEPFDASFRAATVGGRLMAIPYTGEAAYGASYTFIRHDWLEALGLEEPTNQQEMVDAMIAFATQDPDGNGVDDTYGLALVRELWGAQYGLEGFFNAYHAYPNIWYEDEEGNLVYGTVQAEPMKAALADLQKLYAAGAIDPEFIVKDSAKVGESVASLKSGAFYGMWWNMSSAICQSFMNDPEKVPDRWWCLSPLSSDDQPAMLQSTGAIPSTFYVVNKNCEHPEKLFEMINLWFEMMSVDVSPEDYATYVVNEEYTPQNYPFVSQIWGKSVRPEQIRGLQDGTLTLEDCTSEVQSIWANIQSFESGDYSSSVYFDHYWNHAQLPHHSGYVAEETDAAGAIVNDLNFGPTTETEAARGSTLDQLRDEIIVQIITGEQPVDAFDEFIENWYALGGEDIVREKNEWYATVK